MVCVCARLFSTKIIIVVLLDVCCGCECDVGPGIQVSLSSL